MQAAGKRLRKEMSSSPSRLPSPAHGSRGSPPVRLGGVRPNRHTHCWVRRGMSLSAGVGGAERLEARSLANLRVSRFQLDLAVALSLDDTTELNTDHAEGSPRRDIRPGVETPVGMLSRGFRPSRAEADRVPGWRRTVGLCSTFRVRRHVSATADVTSPAPEGLLEPLPSCQGPIFRVS